MTTCTWMLGNTNFDRLETNFLTNRMIILIFVETGIDSKFCKPLTLVLEWIFKVLILLENIRKSSSIATRGLHRDLLDATAA